MHTRRGDGDDESGMDGEKTNGWVLENSEPKWTL